ncbi:unnamed protein product, partial [Scytosiphon promiscuus]
MAEEQQHQQHQQAAAEVGADAIDAAKVGDQHRLRSYLDEQDGDVNLRDDSTQGTLLHWACSYGRLGAVALLLDRGADVRATDNERWTGLHWACHTAATDTARLLLERGAPADERDTQEWTPLHVACHSGRTDTVRFLLTAGSTASARTDKNLTALHIACENQLAQQCSKTNSAPTTPNNHRLLLEAGLSVSAVDDEAYSALHLASAGGHTDVVRLLLQAGAGPDSSTERNHRPLHLAAQYGHSSVVHLLLEAGATVDVRDDGNYTPTHLACTYGHTETTRILLEYGADVEALDSEEWSPFHWACQLGNVYTARLLMSRGADRAARTSRGHQALHLAAENGHTETVRMLLDNQADPNAKDEVLYSPLHWAAQYGHLEVASLLLSNGAGPSHKADYLDTPLHLACLLGHGAVVALLLENGADPTALDEDGKLPEQVVGTAEGSNITASEKEAIARAVMERRRLRMAAQESQEEEGQEHGPGELSSLEAFRRLVPGEFVRMGEGGDRGRLPGAAGLLVAYASGRTADNRGVGPPPPAQQPTRSSGGVSSLMGMISGSFSRLHPRGGVVVMSPVLEGGREPSGDGGGGDAAFASPSRAGPLLPGQKRRHFSLKRSARRCERISRHGAGSFSTTFRSRRPAPQHPSIHPNHRTLSRLRIELDRARKCVACLTRERDTLLFPCKHLVLCGQCYTRVVRQAEDDA